MASKKPNPKTYNDSAYVSEFMSQFEHPFKAEIQAVREIILKTDNRITEGIKWNAPNFYYKGDMAVFTPHVKDHVFMVFPNGILINDDSGLLDGDYVDRRMAHFYSMDDIQKKKASLEKIVRRWIAVMDATDVA
ncbi:MAG: DUF1801 domain-containing protein [Anaerolineaceae bacterium]|nr:DUF1801 domain-containing protein [Anaerolineaceae bacterium]